MVQLSLQTEKMATSPSYPELDDTKHLSRDGLEVDDEKGTAGQMTDQNDGCGEGLRSTNRQASVEQGNKLQDDNTGSHNTLETTKISASRPIPSTDTVTENRTWCFVGQYTEGGKNEDGENPLVEAQELGTGRLQKSSADSPVG